MRRAPLPSRRSHSSSNTTQEGLDDLVSRAIEHRFVFAIERAQDEGGEAHFDGSEEHGRADHRLEVLGQFALLLRPAKHARGQRQDMPELGATVDGSAGGAATDLENQHLDPAVISPVRLEGHRHHAPNLVGEVGLAADRVLHPRQEPCPPARED